MPTPRRHTSLLFKLCDRSIDTPSIPIRSPVAHPPTSRPAAHRQLDDHTHRRYVTYLPAVSDGRMILTTCPRRMP
eukprot:31297-Pelagococcus_subviridis.AAC.13